MQLLETLKTNFDVLTNEEASMRFEKFGPNVLKKQKKSNVFTLFLS